MSTDHVPSTSRYTQGCRCDGCRAENTRYHRAYRLRGGAAPHRLPALEGQPSDLLLAVCWCEREDKLIPTADVWAGRTWSCGHEDCSARRSD